MSYPGIGPVDYRASPALCQCQLPLASMTEAKHQWQKIGLSLRFTWTTLHLQDVQILSPPPARSDEQLQSAFCACHMNVATDTLILAVAFSTSGAR